MIYSLDGDIDYFDIVARVFQGDTLVSFLFIICLDYILQMLIDLMEENRIAKKGQEAGDILWKLILLHTTGMQIHLFKSNLCCIARSRQQEALVSTITKIKRSSCVLLKMALSSH